MKISLTAGLAMLTIAAVGVAGCGGDSTPAPATTAPAAATATTAAAKPDVVVPASGAAQSLSVNVGDTFTVWLNVSRKQAKAKKLPVVGWARNYDDATALTSQGPAQTVPWGKGGLQSQFQFTATTAGSADMGFRQTTSGQSGITPLARTAVVHLTVN